MSLIVLQGEIEKKRGIRYQLDSSAEPIGVGGMGQVFEGECVDEQTGTTRPVAIKFMYDDLLPQAVERARREASIQLRNDNLVEMLGFIETDEVTATGEVVKHHHVVSELLTGVSLADLLDGKTKDRNGQEVPYAVKLQQELKSDPEHFAITIVVNILSGLLALHDAGYIHRDIDPSNIMVTSEGHIKLIDFGIAKQMNNLTTNDRSLTVAGKFMGKPEYAAPELVLGDIKHQNQTTDIYAVGILLYQCIVGHTPFEGARHEILEKQLKTKLPLQQIKNKAIKSIISTACEKKQDLRYQSAAQMRVALETMNGLKRSMTPRKKIIIGVIAVSLIVLGVFGIYSIHQNQQAAQDAEKNLFEKQKAEFSNRIKMMLAEAEKNANVGFKKNGDDYEQSFMKAYRVYEQVEQKMKINKIYAVSVPNIPSLKQDIIIALDSTSVDFERQAQELEALGETQMAESFKQRAISIKNFLNKK